MVKLANWQNEHNEQSGKFEKYVFIYSFCPYANFSISFCQQNGQNEQNGKIKKCIFHSAHSASLLTLPFHSASRMVRMGKSTKTFFIRCSFCQFANFTISFCQQNGKIDRYIFQSAYSAHSASLLTLPFHSVCRMGRMGKSTKTFFILLILPVC